MRDNLKTKEEQVSEGIKGAASVLMDDVERLGKATKEVAADSLQQARKNISALYEKGQGKFQQVESQVESYVQKHPMRVLLVAAGVGFLLGLVRKRAR